MLKVGLTGGIGSGKTTVCSIFEKLGIAVYSADERAKWLAENDPALRSAIIRQFGEEAYSEHGYNTPYIAGLVFNDPELLRKLNELVHPAVAADFLKWIHRQNQAAYIIHEAAILAESGSYRLMDRVIVIDAPAELRIRRVTERDNTDKSTVEARIKNQWPADKIRPIADWIIINDDKTLILPQVLRIHQELLGMADSEMRD
jgi:dephospho-CoA kinase